MLSTELPLLFSVLVVFLHAMSDCCEAASTICIKQGEHGALLLQGDRAFAAPAYPFCKVVDPTGAGDSFAGGFLGYLAREDSLDFEVMERAVICGSVMGSFTVESFSVDRLASLTAEDIDQRYHHGHSHR